MARLTAVDHHVFADTAAGRITELIEQALAARGAAMVSLTGGNTPRDAYAALADASRPWRSQVDWSRVHLYWGDERHVPPEHPDSNYRMADEALVQHVPVPPDQVHRIRAELPDAHDAAADYAGQLPGRFDVMLLGLGDDCHIASIFPGSALLDELQAREGEADKPRPTNDQRVAAVFVPHLNAWRITLTPRVILDSRAIVMVVSGEDKAAAVAAAIDGPLDVARYPGQLLREAGDRVEWLLDHAAAARV